MFDIGFWELLIIAVVLLLVLGPERLPEVAKQAAFFVRKARQGMFRIRNEMRNELGGDPFEGLKEAKREVGNFKNDMKQFGRDLADSHEIESATTTTTTDDVIGPEGEVIPASNHSAANNKASKKVSKKKATKKKAKKKAKKKVKKKSSKKVAKKVDGEEPSASKEP